jgi:hypothetical protein
MGRSGNKFDAAPGSAGLRVESPNSEVSELDEGFRLKSFCRINIFSMVYTMFVRFNTAINEVDVPKGGTGVWNNVSPEQ